MNEAVVNNMSIINGLNKVDGFDPSAFLRRLTGENGEEQFYLDVKYRKLWFRLMHPEGKITKRIIKLENEVAIIESRVYLNRNDTEDAYISCAFAQRPSAEHWQMQALASSSPNRERNRTEALWMHL